MAGRVYVKICGLRDPEHVRVALEAGADAVGVVMNENSSRRATDVEARAVVAAAGGAVDTVLVVNDMPASRAVEVALRLGFDVVQLHGPAYAAADHATVVDAGLRVWRATSVEHTVDRTGDLAGDLTVGAYGEERLLLDAPRPGSGETWDLSTLADRAPRGEWLLAGGLTPGNVAAAVAQVHPWGVDVSSGVERAPGEKDPALIDAFVAAARA